MSGWRVFVLAVVALLSMAPALAQRDGRFAYTEAFIDSPGFKVGCNPCFPGVGDVPNACRAMKDTADIVPYLESRFGAASWAGEFYIALVIRAHDRAKGDALLRRLAQARGQTFLLMAGDSGGSEEVGRFAEHLLREPNFDFHPSCAKLLSKP